MSEEATAAVAAVETTAAETLTAPPLVEKLEKREPSADAPAGEGEATEAAPAADAPAKKEPPSFSVMGKAIREKRRARQETQRLNDEKRRVSSYEQGLREREAQLRAEEEVARRDPLEWAHRKGVSGDAMARHIAGQAGETADEKIARLESAIGEMRAGAERRELEAQRNAVQRQIAASAEAFVAMVDATDDFPAVAVWPPELVARTWSIMKRDNPGVSDRAIAREMEKTLRPIVAERMGKYSKRVSDTPSKVPANGAQQAPGGPASKTTAPRSISSVSSERSSVVDDRPPPIDAPDDVKAEYWMRRHAREASRAG